MCTVQQMEFWHTGRVSSGPGMSDFSLPLVERDEGGVSKEMGSLLFPLPSRWSFLCFVWWTGLLRVVTGT